MFLTKFQLFRGLHLILKRKDINEIQKELHYRSNYKKLVDIIKKRNNVILPTILPKFNHNSEKDFDNLKFYRKYYNVVSKNVVSSLYNRDIKFFKYEF